MILHFTATPKNTMRPERLYMVHITASPGDMVPRPTVIPYTLQTMIHITAAHENMVSGAAVMSYRSPLPLDIWFRRLQ